MTICDKEYIGCIGMCKDCGEAVLSYTCNTPLIAVRPEADEWDWWASCSNKKCVNHYGEGYHQSKPDWLCTTDN
jgi:hypothetical protein